MSENDTNPGVRIFGREPAALVGLVEGILAALLAFQIGVTQDTLGPIMAVVTAVMGVIVAYLTRDTMLGYVVGLVKALFILAAVYGFTFDDRQTGAIIALVTVITAFFQRTQTGPALRPSLRV